MRLVTLSAIVSIAITSVLGADVQYSVVAFPTGNQGVAVSVNGQNVPLQPSTVHPNIFTGTAPYGSTYQYVITEGQSVATPEYTTRSLAEGITSTGNEFFNRSRTIYDIPELPQAYNPIYPTLLTNFNKSNEIATVIMTVNATALDDFIKDPTGKFDDALVSEFAYISNKEVFKFTGAGMSTSGQSTKEFAKLSWAVDLDKYAEKGAPKNRLYGRTGVKFRAHETDSTLTREKLALDMLGASGAACLSGSWVRMYINGEAFGLYLMTDDLTTTFIDNVRYGGDWKNPTTGVTYKGNALSPEEEGNLVYLGEDPSLYPEWLYKLQDTGNDKSVSKKNNSQARLIEFTKRLSQINPSDANAQNPGSIATLMDSAENTLVHIAITFLTGSWDGFWQQASNYYLNEDLETKKWALITYDYDYSFGNGYEPGTNWSTVDYKSWQEPGSKRPLVEAYLNNPYYDGVFQDILKTLIKRFFKPSVVNARLEAWEAMLMEDIVWSRAIPGKSAGQTRDYTVPEFTQGLLGGNQWIISIKDWVTERSSSLAAQLNINDTDDLPPLGPYTSGNYLDADGNVVTKDGTIVRDNGNDKKDGDKDGSSAIRPTVSFGVVIAAILVALSSLL